MYWLKICRHLVCVMLWLTHVLTLNVVFNPNSDNKMMISNSQVQSDFSYHVSWGQCSSPSLYTYKQTDIQQLSNTPTTIRLQNSSLPYKIQLNTRYQILNSTLSFNSCISTPCQVNITNNCVLSSQSIHFYNYFDMLEINIYSNSTYYALSYYVLCNQNYNTNTVEIGLFILIVVATIAIVILALFSRAWSLGGQGIDFNIYIIIAFDICIIIGGIIGYLSEEGIKICLTVVSFVAGIICVAICFNELIFLLRLKWTRILILKLGSFQFRVLEGLSIIVGVGMVVGWWFSDNNIVLNNIVAGCIVVGLVKILKFTSLKLAGLSYFSLLAIEVIVIVILYVQQGQSYNGLFINKYNFPILIQIPTINPVIGQKCGWIPITAVVYPGMLFAYLRRFDTSRNTKVYLVTTTILFLVGSIAWAFINTASPVSLPFGCISFPCMFGLICLFAFRRREIRVLWDGKFYDPEFADQEDMKKTLELVDHRRTSSVKTIDSRLIEELKGNQRNSRYNSEMTDGIRSKFMMYSPENRPSEMGG